MEEEGKESGQWRETGEITKEKERPYKREKRDERDRTGEAETERTRKRTRNRRKLEDRSFAQRLQSRAKSLQTR
jgi:hypothetical protein